MESFIGRKAELQVLEKAHIAAGSAFIPIYGRRRVGKSELILRFLQGKRGIYFVGKQAPQDLQLREFLRESAIALKATLLEGFAASDWESALTAVADAWSADEKLVIVFDEFQWSAESAPDLPSALQKLWDRKWRDRGNIFLIICGSSIGFMEREVLGRKSPLFGRRTGQIFLQPFGYREAGEFHPDYSLMDRARTYFICGGVPWYLNFFDSHQSVEMNIVENLLTPYAPLFQEPDFLLREELRDVKNYYAILLSIASGFTSQTAIAQKTGVDSRGLHYYLKQLRELGYISRHHPLTPSPPEPRRVRYILDDPLLRFWFRFIYPNTSFIAHAGGEKAMAARVSPGLDAYFGYCFERLCREALPALYIKEGVNAGFTVGEYWHSKVQIDVVGVRDDNWIDLGECKWGKTPSSAALHTELRAKASHYPNPDNRTVALRAFTRSLVRPKTVQGVRFHSLDDLYEAP